MKILIEGPDKTGKTTLAMGMAVTEQSTFLHLPAAPFREMIISGDVKGTPGTFLLFADTMTLWSDPPEDFVLDRDILSMLAYQSYLFGNMNPIIVLNLYKSIVYKDNRPDKIMYLTNPPFEEYEKDNPFEMHGYEKIRDCFEMAIKLVELNWPEIEIERVDVRELS